MTVLFCARQARQHFAFLVEKTVGIEEMSIITKSRRIVIHLPNIGDDDGTLRNEVALVEVVFSTSMGSAACSSVRLRKALKLRVLT